MAEFEFAGTTFRGGKMFMVLTALSTLGGAAWGGFEFYNDYRNMKEIVENIDVDAIKAENTLVIQKMDEQMIRIEEAIEYTRDIKSGLRDDILSVEKQVDRMEDKIRSSEQETRELIVNAEERFEAKRDALQNDYDQKASRLAERNDNTIKDLETKVARDLKDLEDQLTKKLQRSLDNPLAN
jgi:hypothetical protein